MLWPSLRCRRCWRDDVIRRHRHLAEKSHSVLGQYGIDRHAAPQLETGWRRKSRQNSQVPGEVLLVILAARRRVDGEIEIGIVERRVQLEQHDLQQIRQRV